MLRKDQNRGNRESRQNLKIFDKKLFSSCVNILIIRNELVMFKNGRM